MAKAQIKSPDFFKIRGNYYNRKAILSVKKASKASVDMFSGIPRQWIITMTAEAEPDPKYQKVWCSDKEIAPILKVLDKECPLVESESQNETQPNPHEDDNF